MSTTKPGMPYANNRIATYLAKRIDALSGKKSQREIAAEIGYDKPNVISMFKRGEMKVPLDKVPALAKAIDVDPAHLFRLAMEQYWPDQHEAISAVFGTVVTKNEAEIVGKIRELTNNSDPELTPDMEQKLASAFKAA